MAFSACIGGPMLNILLGVGGSGTYITRQTGDQVSFHFPPTLMVSSIGLLTVLVITLLLVPYNGYWLTKSWGAFLICCYFLIMTANFIVEMKRT
jgi:solute carrier family 24 (sodium/potassium/calcium exchanger), member 6